MLSRQIVAEKGDLGMEVLPEICSVLVSFSFLSMVRWRLRNRLQESSGKLILNSCSPLIFLLFPLNCEFPEGSDCNYGDSINVG